MAQGANSSESFYFNGTLNIAENSSFMAISEGRDRQEIGFSILNVETFRSIYLNQVVDNFWFSETMKKILLFDIKVIIIPDVLFNAMAIPKLLQIVKEKFPQMIFIKWNFRTFDHQVGGDVVQKMCAPEFVADLIKYIEVRRYAFASLSGLCDFLAKKGVSFAAQTIRIEFLASLSILGIDIDTVHRLELIESASQCITKRSKFSLFALLNTCVTKMGKTALRSAILAPSCDLDTILDRQSCITELVETHGLMFNIRQALECFKDVHRLMKIPYSITITDNVKAAETMLDLMMILKYAIESIEPLRAALEPAQCPFLQYICAGLANPIYGKMMLEICKVLEPEIQIQRSRTYFQRLFMVKAGVNEFLDVLRTNFSRNIDEIREHIDEMAAKTNLPLKMIHTVHKGFYMRLHFNKNFRTVDYPEELQVTSITNKFACLTSAKLYTLNDNIQKIGNQMQIMSNMIICQLFQEVRTEIHMVYSLIDLLTEIDLMLSLAEYSKSKSGCKPEFGVELEIVDGIHPLFEITSKTDIIMPNNIMANPEYNFFVISGNNMCGKTTYIKMIAMLQILAQIGCYIPAKSAKMRICDHIFTRIGFEDNCEQNLSSFTAEMQDMEFILRNLTPTSLVIIDELCRSTNIADAEILSWCFCEKLIQFHCFLPDFDDSTQFVQKPVTAMKLSQVCRPFIFLVTHFEHLLKLSDKFMNVANLRFSEEKQAMYADSQSTHIPLKLVKCVRFPDCIVKRAEELLNDPHMFTQSSFEGEGEFNANASVQVGDFNGTYRELYDVAAILCKAFRSDNPNDETNLQRISDALTERFKTLLGTTGVSGSS